MTSSQVILTGASRGGEGSATLRVWRDTGNPGEIAVAAEERLESPSGYFKATVPGLAPGVRYRYAFFVPSHGAYVARSGIGSFRTALPEECEAPVFIAGTHGTNREHQPFSALEITARYDIDLFVQLGDYSYNDGAISLDDFRSRWDSTLADEAYRTLLARTGQYIVWDDHEFRDNASYYADMKTPDFRAALDAFYERNPVPRRPGDRYWRSYRWGKTVEFFALDCRSERLYELPQMQLGPVQYVSIDQMEWLKDALLQSPCHFKVVLNSVPITNFPGLWDLAALDRWEGFPDQRAELLDFIVGRGIDNVWFLSGDFHTGSVGKVEREPPWNTVREILMGPGGNKGNPMWFFYDALGAAEQVAPSDQFEFFYGLPNATLMRFDPALDSVTVTFIDAETEEVLFEETL